MNRLSPLPPPDTPETTGTPDLVVDSRREKFLTNNTLTDEQAAVFHRLWDLIGNATDGSSLEEIHEGSAAA